MIQTRKRGGKKGDVNLSISAMKETECPQLQVIPLCVQLTRAMHRTETSAQLSAVLCGRQCFP